MGKHTKSHTNKPHFFSWERETEDESWDGRSMTKGRKERNDEKLTNQRGCKQKAAGQKEGKETEAETDKGRT